MIVYHLHAFYKFFQRDSKLAIIEDAVKNIVQNTTEGLDKSQTVSAIWPSCCGLNSDFGDKVFGPSVDVDPKTWAGCYEPINPYAGQVPKFSLYEIDCICTIYTTGSGFNV